MNKQFRSNSAGFTLVELLAVVVIIILLIGLISGTARFIQTKVGIARTESEMATIELALEEIKNQTGSYPGSLPSDLNKRVSGYTGNDFFGSGYQYRCPGTYNTASFDLWSYGPDRVGGSYSNDLDNINNWK